MPCRRTVVGSSASRIPSSIAMGISISARNRATSSRSRQGCSTYSIPYRPNRRRDVRAWSRLHIPFTSRRIRPPAPVESRASRTATTRASSSATDVPIFTLMVRHPLSTIAARANAPAAGDSTAGMIALTSTDDRCAAGNSPHDASRAAASQRALRGMS